MKLSLLAAVVLAFSLAACANGEPAGDSAAPAASSVPTISVEPPMPSDGATTTISGTIDAGVEPNCIVLDKHLLVLKDAEQKAIARPGASVTVTGTPKPDMMTTCMQGTPFVVTSIQAS
jgi:hypothetical protein